MEEHWILFSYDHLTDSAGSHDGNIDNVLHNLENLPCFINEWSQLIEMEITNEDVHVHS